jgi:hypothetical protein
MTVRSSNDGSRWVARCTLEDDDTDAQTIRVPENRDGALTIVQSVGSTLLVELSLSSAADLDGADGGLWAPAQLSGRADGGVVTLSALQDVLPAGVSAVRVTRGGAGTGPTRIEVAQ